MRFVVPAFVGLVPLLAPALSGCASATYSIHSNPAGAEVFYVDPANQKRFLLGTTPLSYSKSSLPSDTAFLISVEKEGFKPQSVPMASTDESRTVVTANLKPDEAGATTKFTREMNQVLSQLFSAQQMIYDRKFHAAIVEIDKVIKERPDLAQAYVMKGTSYFLLNDLSTAIEAWETAVKLDPENADLKRFLAQKKSDSQTKGSR